MGLFSGRYQHDAVKAQAVKGVKQGDLFLAGGLLGGVHMNRVCRKNRFHQLAPIITP
jgi:hypothetical protein